MWALLVVNRYSLKSPSSVYRCVTRTPNKHALSSWIQLANDAEAVEDTDNAVLGVWFSGVCAVEGLTQVLKARSTYITWHYCCKFANSGNKILSGLQVIVIEFLCYLFVCGLFNDTVSSLEGRQQTEVFR